MSRQATLFEDTPNQPAEPAKKGVSPVIFAKLFEMTLPALPVPQPRQRHAVIAGHVHNYTPTKDPVNAYKAALQIKAGELIKSPLLGPLAVRIRFFLPRPQALAKKKGAIYDVPVPHMGRPDLDNLLKSTLDALKGITWMDDKQIYTYQDTGKWYVERNGQPRVEITVAADCSVQTVLKIEGV